YALEAAEEAHVPARFAQHAGRDVERDDVGASVAALQLASDAAGAGAEVHDDIGRELEEIEPLQKLVADAGLKDCGLFVITTRAVERTAHARIVEARGRFCASGGERRQ